MKVADKDALFFLLAKVKDKLPPAAQTMAMIALTKLETVVVQKMSPLPSHENVEYVSLFAPCLSDFSAEIDK